MYTVDDIKGDVLMYDLTKRFYKENLTVEELIEQLNKLPQQAKICICGDDCCYIHVEKDGSVVNLDAEALDDCYEEMVTPVEEGVFIYGNHRFIPYGFFTKQENDDLKHLTKKLRTDTDLGFFADSNVAGRIQKYRYDYDDFYAAAGDHTFDIFKCIDNGKLYAPGAHELFEYCS